MPVAGPARQLLMVCTANIARSPSAEVLARQMLAESDRPHGWTVASAGVQAIPGAGLDPTMGAELLQRGLDPSRHRARQLNATIMDAADLVLTFETRHRSWILAEWPGAARRVFTIRRAAALLADRPRRADAVDYLAADDTGHTSADNFADPYGLGADAARVAVAEIEHLLTGVVRALTA